MTELRETDKVDVFYADHPPRSDSPEYLRTRKWLLTTQGGCYVCGGPVDLSHPEASPAVRKAMQDHHGAGIHAFNGGKVSLVALGLAPVEWAGGWGADPAKVQRFASLQWAVSKAMSSDDIGPEPKIATTEDVMAWTDSKAGASVRLCAPHHVGTPGKHTPDAQGHEAVGIHHLPFPIWSLQATCAWDRFDMWAGTTGTVAVAAPRQDGSVLVLHAEPVIRDILGVRGGEVIPASHPLAARVHAD